MLNGIHLVDFGNHRNTRLTFGPMTALVGQNGSGKTTVMRAVGELKRAAQMRTNKQWDSVPFSGADIRKGCNAAVIATGWEAAWKSVPGTYGLNVLGPRGSLAVATWIWANIPVEGVRQWIPAPHAFSDGDFASNIKPEAPDPGANVSNAIFRRPQLFRLTHPPRIIDASLERCRYFKTSARSLQRPAFADHEAPSINDDGSNLAWALSYLMTAEPDRFLQIINALREVVSVVKRVRSRPAKLNRLEKRTITIDKQERSFDEEREVMGQELIFDMKSGDGLPATSVSEGTLVVLAILTLVYGSDADLIMLDDVELGLHPKAQRDLIRQLRRIQEKHPKLQILISTHSPYVIDEFKAEDVWVFAPDKEGCAMSKRLSEHPDAKRALEVLTTGEFWSAEGEPWVLDAEPTARVAEEPSA